MTTHSRDSNPKAQRFFAQFRCPILILTVYSKYSWLLTSTLLYICETDGIRTRTLWTLIQRTNQFPSVANSDFTTTASDSEFHRCFMYTNHTSYFSLFAWLRDSNLYLHSWTCGVLPNWTIATGRIFGQFVCSRDGARTRDLLRDRQAL